jgi:hypothetical protein
LWEAQQLLVADCPAGMGSRLDWVMSVEGFHSDVIGELMNVFHIHCLNFHLFDIIEPHQQKHNNRWLQIVHVE